MVQRVGRFGNEGKTLAARRVAFRKALALAETTQAAWAESQGVTPTHLSFVLNGHRESMSLTAKVDAFIAEHLPERVA